VCLAQQSGVKQRQEWLSSGNIVRGKIQVKENTLNTLLEGKHLLVNSVQEVMEPFEKGEVFEILVHDRKSVAVARSRISSTELGTLSQEDSRLLALSDEIILL